MDSKHFRIHARRLNITIQRCYCHSDSDFARCGVNFECDIVKIDDPLLLGLEVMRQERIVIDVHKLELYGNKWSLTLTLSYGNFVSIWTWSTYYTRKELVKFHIPK